MVKENIIVTSQLGIHLRPAGAMCDAAIKFDSNISFEYAEGKTANAKSVISILASGVKCGDEITLIADGSDEEQELIQEASDADIPVVTVLTDDSSSARISFVGLNSYQLGNAYTEQILGLLKEHENTQVLLLSNSQSKTQETNLIYYQIKKELEEKKKDYQTVTISEYNIDSSSGFDTEEFVRDIFVSEENLPDVLVCMDEVVTECVYQALVDYNQVGNVDVVGFYYSDVILDGISKGIISSAIALDMDEIGRYSVNALEEFSSLGHTSNYYSVGQHVITRSNVGAYRTEGN